MRIFISPDAACEKVRRSLDSSVSGEFDEAGIRQHLEICPVCSAMFEGRERVRQLVRRAVRRETAPESLRGRIQEMLRRG
jgi:mycothiol system anti-sigma-R factor